MGNFIDRNPEDMKAYAKIVKDYAANMVQLIRTTQGALSFYESELDDRSRKCIEKFNDDCTNFLREPVKKKGHGKLVKFEKVIEKLERNEA